MTWDIRYEQQQKINIIQNKCKSLVALKLKVK